jgi:hypothetical protein
VTWRGRPGRPRRRSPRRGSEFTAVQSQLQASRIVAHQPDWSLLLAVLGTTTGEHVVLRGLRVQPAEPAPARARDGGRAPAAQAAAVPPGPSAAGRSVAAAAPAGESSFQLNLNGLARSPTAVSQFVLRLERAGLFGRVTLRDTGREPFLGGEAVSFRLECSFDDSPGAAPRPRRRPGWGPPRARPRAPPREVGNEVPGMSGWKAWQVYAAGVAACAGLTAGAWAVAVRPLAEQQSGAQALRAELAARQRQAIRWPPRWPTGAPNSRGRNGRSRRPHSGWSRSPGSTTGSPR